MPKRFETLIRGGSVVTSAGIEEVDLCMERGSIAAILPPGSGSGGDVEIEAAGLVITPGGIDTHTHIHWPHDGTHTTDDFYTATRAAVLGGTTTIVDFVPPGDDDLRERCQARVDEASADSVIDFGFHPILTSATRRTLNAIEDVVAEGFTSFKMYTTYEDRRIDDGAAWQLMNAIAAAGGMPGFHAENHELLASVLERQVEEGHVSLRDYPASRPALAEAESIQMVSLYAERIGTPVYIFHVSGTEAMESVRLAKASGVEIYAETCTHYLTLDDSVFASDDAWKYVISPPLRSARDREYLWGAIGDGTVTAVGSDHCAYELGLKKVGYDDHREVPAGAPGIEARTPILFASAVQRKLGYELFSDISARRAATALGLYPRKGAIQVGADADVVLWDATSEWQGSMLAKSSQSTFALYDSFKGKGRPRHVFIRGNQLVRDGEFVGTRGTGRFIRRQPRQSRVKV